MVSLFRIIKLCSLDIQAIGSVVYMKNDKAVVTLHFIHLVYSRLHSIYTTNCGYKKNCLSIYILQTCSQNFYYLHGPALWLSKWHSAVHHRLLCGIKSISNSGVPRILSICLCLQIWDKCILFPPCLWNSAQG